MLVKKSEVCQVKFKLKLLLRLKITLSHAQVLNEAQLYSNQRRDKASVQPLSSSYIMPSVSLVHPLILMKGPSVTSTKRHAGSGVAGMSYYSHGNASANASMLTAEVRLTIRASAA